MYVCKLILRVKALMKKDVNQSLDLLKIERSIIYIAPCYMDWTDTWTDRWQAVVLLSTFEIFAVRARPKRGQTTHVPIFVADSS